MQTLPEKTVETILRQQDPRSILGLIQKKIDELKNINQLWHSEISSELSQHSRVANFRDDCLIVEVDNAVWATHLRYLAMDLMKQLLKHPALQSLKHIEWTIQPRFHPVAKQYYSPPNLSNRNTQLLKNTASNACTKSLQDALCRLSEAIIQ